MASDNLKQHLVDGTWLIHFAQQEFCKAIRTGRMIAFTGSYATEGLGYPKWHEFLLDGVTGITSGKLPDWAEQAKVRINNNDANSPAYFGIFEEKLKDIEPSRKKISEKFQLIPYKVEFDKLNSARFLVEYLGIDRIITLNYDLELEWHLMTTKFEKSGHSSNRKKFFSKTCPPQAPNAPHKNSLVRTLPDGRSAVSDIFDRDRTDRLIEFAVGSPDYEAHIMHLHGRADIPKSMIVSLRDYQRQYRRSSISKLPFEHAQKILFAGNPVLFFGIGMSEDYVNSVLEQFVSDRSDRFVAPAFVLWSPAINKVGQQEAELKRLFWYHRYRVLTIFDHELENFGKHLSTGRFERIADSLKLLGNYAESVAKPKRWHADEFRNATTRLTTWATDTGFHVWRRARKVDPAKIDIISPTIPASVHATTNTELRDWPIFKELFCGNPVKAIIHAPGYGHGWLSKTISSAFESGAHLPEKFAPAASIINGSFVCEIDSTFALISGLFDGKTSAQQQQSRKAGLETMKNGVLQALLTNSLPTRKVLLVINGMDRFLDTSGRALSAELDTMLRTAIDLHRQMPSSPGDAINPLTIIAMGTQRVRRYLETIYSEHSNLNESTVDMGIQPNSQPEKLIELLHQRALGTISPNAKSRYFHAIGTENNLSPSIPPTVNAAIAVTENGRPGEYRHAYLSMLLRSSILSVSLKNAGKSEQLADLCLDIIAMLALIGQPVEQSVIHADPRVRQRVAILKRRKIADPLGDALAFMTEKLFVLDFAPFIDGKNAASGLRYGLHRAVMAEMRDRFGLPLSDARLSCGFNLSLYASQPTDDYTPDPEMQQRLGDLFDAVLRDTLEPIDKKLQGALSTIHKSARKFCCPGLVHRMRAALGILRSYLSISTLLMQPPHRERDALGVGEQIQHPSQLSLHSDRLEKLIRLAEQCAKHRNHVLSDSSLATAHSLMGPEPFFPDDLVWLHNEFGVVKLAQGDLYEARQAFKQAERINAGFVEFGDQLQNWQRIQLNLLHSDVERGKIAAAEARMRDLEAAISSAHPKDSNGKLWNVLDQIYNDYGKQFHRKIIAVDKNYRFDVILAAGLMAGYRGWIYLLSGKKSVAKESLEVANIVLSNLGELRACSIFERFRSSWFDQNHDSHNAIISAKLSITSAESINHLDIANLAQIAKVTYQLHGSDLKNSSLISRQLLDSLRYGYDSDVYRVRIDARQALAALQLMGGDYDGALEHAADGMAMATRFGFSLKKTTLRILIGQILIKRGDGISGIALIQQATRNADRIGYQRAMEHAREVKLEEGL